jgi:hypothetical protein
MAERLKAGSVQVFDPPTLAHGLKNTGAMATRSSAASVCTAPIDRPADTKRGRDEPGLPISLIGGT